jgi:hypothetical protein
MKFAINNVNDKKAFEDFLNDFVKEFPEQFEKQVESSKLTKFAIKAMPNLKFLFKTVICDWSFIDNQYFLTVSLGIENLPNVTKTLRNKVIEKVKSKFPDINMVESI